jgi:hypothetical protein
MPNGGFNSILSSQHSMKNKKDTIDLKFNKNLYSFTTRKKQIKKQSINVHLTKNHEFDLNVNSLINSSAGNSLMKKMEAVLSKKVVEEIIKEGFPIKIQIPMSLSLRANVYIKRFERIKPQHNIDSSFFQIPE